MLQETRRRYLLFRSEMTAVMSIAFIVVIVLLAVRLEGKHIHDPTDSFKMIGAFPELVALYSSSEDPSLDCVIITRTNFNNKSKVATYVWNLKGNGNAKKQSVFHITKGNAPDQVQYILDDDGMHPHTAYYNYTDYKNCIVTIIPYYKEDLCMMLINPASVDTIPQDCMEEYVGTCNVKVKDYDKEKCAELARSAALPLI
ncbi:uncharacterized protein LOC144134582 [Amblyomma americanum]